MLGIYLDCHVFSDPIKFTLWVKKMPIKAIAL